MWGSPGGEFSRGWEVTVSCWRDGYPASLEKLKTPLHRLRPAIEYNGANPGGTRPGSQKTPRANSLPNPFLPEILDHTNPQFFVYGLRSVSQAVLAPYADAFLGLVTCGYPHPFLLPAGAPVPIYLEVIPSEGGEAEVVAYAAGITTCGSPWACPVCAPGLGHRRGEVLARALERLQGMGYRVAHAVLTVQHTRGDSLATLRRVL